MRKGSSHASTRARGVDRLLCLPERDGLGLAWWYHLPIKYESKNIFDLIQKGITFNEPGNYEPPPAPKNETRYNTTIAQHIQQLET